ncbi:MAG: alanine dehydrogenase [Actinomycetota bacterium]
MIVLVGVPTEVKDSESRVAMTPDGVRELVSRGHEVRVQRGAGLGSSITDDEYAAAGAMLSDVEGAWAAELVVKVKEPQTAELPHLRADLLLATYLHLAAYPDVAAALVAAGTTAVGYETVQLEDGSLPLLAPMSEVAGRMATQIGAHYLERENGGRGVLLGGAPGVRPGRVVVIGAGNVGWNAAWIAAGMEAEVVLLDRNLDRLRWVDQIHKGRIMTLASNRGAVERAVAEADLVVGAVLVAGGRAPVVVTDEMVRGMRTRSVIVDVAIDQGGCVEGIRETTHSKPVYERHGVVHYAVGNIPGAVPHTSTYALTNATLPYLTQLADHGIDAAAARDPAIAHGINTRGGAVVNPVVAAAIGS